MPYDFPEKAPAANSAEHPGYTALNEHLLKERGYGFSTFYGKKLALDTKIAHEKRELTLPNLTEQEKTNIQSRLEDAEAQLEKLLGDKETRLLWLAYEELRPDLGLDKKTLGS